jgi:hypothetical protein
VRHVEGGPQQGVSHPIAAPRWRVLQSSSKLSNSPYFWSGAPFCAIPKVLRKCGMLFWIMDPAKDLNPANLAPCLLFLSIVSQFGWPRQEG